MVVDVVDGRGVGDILGSREEKKREGRMRDREERERERRVRKRGVSLGSMHGLSSALTSLFGRG